MRLTLQTIKTARIIFKDSITETETVGHGGGGGGGVGDRKNAHTITLLQKLIGNESFTLNWTLSSKTFILFYKMY